MLFTVLFGGLAVSLGLVQTIYHIGGGKSGYVFGNAAIFGIVLEALVLWNTVMFAGTVTSLLINTISGLMVYGILELGASIYGGKGLRWSWSEKGNGRLGFYTVEVLPTLTMALFAKWIKQKLGSFKYGIYALVSAFRAA
jgi:hypothetical protein